MKIPETSANVGAYYGNDENGQWQPNGMIIDSGVGGGVVGSGDAGLHRPPYPLHMPRPGPHIPGYVMAGAYYPAGYPAGGPGVPPHGPGVQPDDFADYMWMENEEEFDKQVMQQLEEEALMEQCIEAMLEDEQRERHAAHPPHAPHPRARARHNGHTHHTHHTHHYPTTSNGNPSLSLEETVSRSTLNPLAAEFVPTRQPAPPPPQTSTATTVTEDKEKPESPPEEPAAQETKASEEETPPAEQRAEAEPAPAAVARVVAEESTAEVEPVPVPSDPPEVSAADVLPDRARPRDARKDPRKQPLKQDTKKAKPQVVRSETRVQPRKRDVRSVKSEVKVDDKLEETAPAPPPVVVETVAKPPQALPVEEPTPAGPKPINYAAAAKANKPKKPTTPPSTNDRAPPTIRVVENKKPKAEKTTVKTEKPIQRKNSANSGSTRNGKVYSWGPLLSGTTRNYISSWSHQWGIVMEPRGTTH